MTFRHGRIKPHPPTRRCRGRIVTERLRRLGRAFGRRDVRLVVTRQAVNTASPAQSRSNQPKTRSMSSRKARIIVVDWMPTTSRSNRSPASCASPGVAQVLAEEDAEESRDDRCDLERQAAPVACDECRRATVPARKPMPHATIPISYSESFTMSPQITPPASAATSAARAAGRKRRAPTGGLSESRK